MRGSNTGSNSFGIDLIVVSCNCRCAWTQRYARCATARAQGVLLDAAIILRQVCTLCNELTERVIIIIALEMKVRSLENFMDVCDEKMTDVDGFLPAACDQSKNTLMKERICINMWPASLCSSLSSRHRLSVVR